MTQQEAASMLREWYIAFDRHGKGNERTVKEFLEIADMLEDMAKRVPRWISVEERLPEDGVEVIVHSDRFGGSTHTAYYRHARQEWFEHNGVRLIPNVWHWMPLPEPPDNEKKGDN